MTVSLPAAVGDGLLFGCGAAGRPPAAAARHDTNAGLRGGRDFIARLRERDEGAFTSLYRETGAALYYFILGRVGRDVRARHPPHRGGMALGSRRRGPVTG